MCTDVCVEEFHVMIYSHGADEVTDLYFLRASVLGLYVVSNILELHV